MGMFKSWVWIKNKNVNWICLLFYILLSMYLPINKQFASNKILCMAVIQKKGKNYVVFWIMCLFVFQRETNFPLLSQKSFLYIFIDIAILAGFL